MVNKDYQL